MDKLEQLRKQKADIEAQIDAELAKEVDAKKKILADTVADLREAKALQQDIEAVFTGGDGLFNPWRKMRVKKG